MKISSRQRRLLNEQPVGIVRDEPEPEPGIGGEAEVDPNKDRKFDDRHKMRASMIAVHILYLVIDLIERASNILKSGTISFSLGNSANLNTGTMSQPYLDLQDIVKRINSTLYKMALSRGPEVLSTFNHYNNSPKGTLHSPSAAGEDETDIEAFAPEEEEEIELAAPASAPEKSQALAANVNRDKMQVIEEACEEIGLTENEKTILYGAINSFIAEAVTTTGAIAFRDNVLKPMEKPKKHWIEDPELKNEENPDWFGKYL